MKYLFTLTLFMLIISLSYAQHRAVSQPGYNPTVPRLVSMQHKAVSHKSAVTEITIQHFDLKVNSEDINVYMVYEKDSTVGTQTGDQDLFFPPLKLMDLYLIYDYTFRIYVSSHEMINQMIPNISLSPGGYVDHIRLVNYFADAKGKLKDKKIKKSALLTDIKDGFLSISSDVNQFADNSYVEVNVQIKSRNFNRITPSVSDLDFFEKSLTISYPSIFKYSMPETITPLSISTIPFELLHFRRDTGPGNGHIDKVVIDSKILSFKILENTSSNVELIFERLALPSNSDIGIEAKDILRVL